MANGRKRTTRRYKRNTRGRKLTVRQKRQVKRLVGVNIEKKYVLHQSSGVVIATPTLLSITGGITQGTSDVANRIGDSIKLSMLQVRFTFFNTNITEPIALLRVIIFRWKDASSTLVGAPGYGDVVQDVNYTFVSPIHVDNTRAGRLHIIYDGLFPVNEQSMAYNTFKRTFYGRKLGKKHVNYVGSGVTASDHVYVYIVSDSSAQPHPSLNMNALLMYTDA